MNRPASLILTGDVMLGRGVDESLRDRGPAHPWGDVLRLLREADLTVVNLECVIAAGGRPWSRWPKAFHFRADSVAIQSLRRAGVDCVTLANNHVLDYEEDAMLEMLDRLRRGEIAFAGAGRDLEEAGRPAMLEAPGVRVGVVAFTDNEPGWAARPDAPGTNYIPIALDEGSLGPVRGGIARAREAGADLVIFAIHWGPNMVERPTPLFREFAHAVIEMGVDIFFGHSSHIFQGIELHQGRPIVYDAGDFVDDYVVDRELRNDRSLLFRLEADRSGVRRIELIPVAIRHRQVNHAVGFEREAIADRIGRLSAEMGTSIRHEENRLWIAVREQPGLPAENAGEYREPRPGLVRRKYGEGR